MGKNDERKGQLVDIGEDYNPNRQSNGYTGEEQVDIQDNGDTKEEENIDKQASGDTGEGGNRDRQANVDTMEEETRGGQTNGDTRDVNTDTQSNGDTGEENTDRQSNGDNSENTVRQSNGDTGENTEDNSGQALIENALHDDEGHRVLYGLIADMDITSINSFLNQYVVVLYDNDLYPGYVEDVEGSDLYCECMHKVGRRENCFFWPMKIKDKCWYELENVLAIIPQPEKIEGSHSHFCVQKTLWEQIRGEKVDIHDNGDTKEEENIYKQANGDTGEVKVDKQDNGDTNDEENIDIQANGDTGEEKVDIQDNGDTKEEENIDKQANGDTGEEKVDIQDNGDTKEEENIDKQANGDTGEVKVDTQDNGDTKEENTDKQANGDTGEEKVDIQDNGDTKEEENIDKQANVDTGEGENRDRQANVDTVEEETRGGQTNGDTRDVNTDTQSNGDTGEENTDRQSNGDNSENTVIQSNGDTGENTEDNIGQALIENALNDDEGHLYVLIADMDITSINSFLNQYVVVLYDNDLYPAYVEDVEGSDLYCECMHKVGRRENCFSWPMKIKDKCWYELENVLAIIPQPEKIEGSHSHFCVQKTLWEKIKLLLKGKYKQ